MQGFDNINQHLKGKRKFVTEESAEDRKIGIDIEHEHLPTLNKIKAYVKEHDGEFPDIEMMATWIHDDHVAEFPEYYNDENGLPAMERELKFNTDNIKKEK